MRINTGTQGRGAHHDYSKRRALGLTEKKRAETASIKKKSHRREGNSGARQIGGAAQKLDPLPNYNLIPFCAEGTGKTNKGKKLRKGGEGGGHFSSRERGEKESYIH